METTAEAQAQSAIDQAHLPDNVHAQVLITQFGHRAITAIVVWSAITAACPSCGSTRGGRPDVSQPPVNLEPTIGTIERPDVQHSCGSQWGPAWNAFYVREHAPSSLVSKVEVLARQVAAEYQHQVATLTHEIATQLRNELTDALHALPDDLAPADRPNYATGSATTPGVYWDGDTWTAWDYVAEGVTDEVIAVSARTLEDIAVKADSPSPAASPWTDG